jgi:hypothetical protein
MIRTTLAAATLALLAATPGHAQYYDGYGNAVQRQYNDGYYNNYNSYNNYNNYSRYGYRQGYTNYGNDYNYGYRKYHNYYSRYGYGHRRYY